MVQKTVRYHGYGKLTFNESEAGFILTHPETGKTEVLVSMLDDLYEANIGVLPVYYDRREHTEGEHDEVKSVLEGANIRIYSTDKPCSLEEAEGYLIESIYGDLDTTTQNFGYTEFTIMGFYLKEMKIGGHDLMSILQSLENKYVHFVLEVPVYVKDTQKITSFEVENGKEDELVVQHYTNEGENITPLVPIIGYISDSYSYKHVKDSKGKAFDILNKVELVLNKDSVLPTGNRSARRAATKKSKHKTKSRL